MVKGPDGLGFLLSAELPDPEARISRRKRKRDKAAQQGDEELPAEQRPRHQKQWMEDAKKASSLPTAGGEKPPGIVAAEKNDAAGGAVGKKKAKRLADLMAKKAKKAEKNFAAQKKEFQTAADQVQGKKKAPGVSWMATEILQKCHGGAVQEQRLLAIVADRIAGNPEGEIECYDVFMELHRIGSDVRTRQMALLSAVAVFRDLVPTYRIREPTAKEKTMPKTKGVLMVEKFELTLLQKYKRLLPALEAAMKLEPVAIAPALAALVKAASEFNYRQRLIGTAVRHASSKHESVRKVISDALGDMMEADQRLEASREVVLAIGRLAQGAAIACRNKGKGQGSVKLREELLEVIRRIPVGRAETVTLQEARGLHVADEEVRKGLAEASIKHSAETLRKAETELLTEIFIVYLRVLRQRRVHSTALVAAALAGLAQWGQQVNLELLLEILVELRGVVEDAITQADELVALQGLRCALVLLTGPSQALMTDVTWLSDAVKNAFMLALPSLHSTHSQVASWPPANWESTEKGLQADGVPMLILQCLEAALRCPQAYGRASDTGLAMLIEQLFCLAATADGHVGLVFLREGGLLLRKHPRLRTLLDVEGGLFGRGGLLNQSLTVVWHLHPLGFSVLPETTRVSRALPAAIPKPGAAIGELFPMRDGRSWLLTEVQKHITALGTVKTQEKGNAKHSGATRFATEAELRATCKA
mmetsp:Transcript_65472/g.142794  ORF Transcript_65472/g.142794 Transcript_65472/m.142794 type:complete len:706 (-) Transcript_65472:60-2177(-)